MTVKAPTYFHAKSFHFTLIHCVTLHHFYYTCKKTNVKFILEQDTEAQKGNTRWRWVENSTPRLFYPREIPGTHHIEGWLGPVADLDRC